MLTVAHSRHVKAKVQVEVDCTTRYWKLCVAHQLIDPSEVRAKEVGGPFAVVGAVAEPKVMELGSRCRRMRVADRDRVELLRVIAGGVEHHDRRNLLFLREEVGEWRHAQPACITRDQLLQHGVDVAERQGAVLTGLATELLPKALDDRVYLLARWREARDLRGEGKASKSI